MSELFHERMKTARGDWPTTFTRSDFSQKARQQCWYTFNEALSSGYQKPSEIRERIFKIIQASEGLEDDPFTGLEEFFLEKGLMLIEEIEVRFSILELMCRTLKRLGKEGCIQIINLRLQQAGIGYKYTDGQLIPVDDDNLSQSAVLPVISLLNRPEFEDPHRYLCEAFSKYRSNDYEGAIDNTQKSGEALLRHIFDRLGIKYTKRDSYIPLVLKARDNGLLVGLDDDKLNPLMNQLKGLGNIRSKGGGHAKNSEERMETTDRLVRLAIHHAAANLLYIAETYLENKDKLKVKKAS